MSRRRGLGLALALLGSFAGAEAVPAARIVIVNLDDPGEGFNDPRAVSPVPGNPATTLGQQRLNAFRAAAEIWGAKLESNVAIRVGANMDPLDCDSTTGVLGSAGPEIVIRAEPGDEALNFPRLNTWYPVALGNALAGEDLDPGRPDIGATFNSQIDFDPGCLGTFNWWYGIDSPAPPRRIDFFSTVLHELAHGLGFISLVDDETGELLNGFDDAFSNNLEDHSLGLTWDEMDDFQRLASSTDEGDLHWVGPNVVDRSRVLQNGRHPSGHVRMYAPSQPDPGSSVSHFDTVLSPNELMEPFESPGFADILTTELLEDLGWNSRTEIPPPGVCNPDATTLCLNQGRFQVRVQFRSAQGMTGSGNTLVLNGIDDSALFWFFDADNLEMLIKVLDGCSINNRFWVFFAATTDVEFTLTVIDVLTGATQVYFNPLGQPANAVTDTDAMATCSVSSAVAGQEGRTTLGGPSIRPLSMAELVELEEIGLRTLLADLRGSDDPSELRILAPRVAPAGPTDLVATTLSETEIRLDWVDNSDDETEFRIEVKIGESDFVDVGFVPANSVGAIASELQPDTTYTFRVRARNAAGDSAYSNEASATTFGGDPEGVPEAPTDLAATPLSSSEILLDWRDNSDNENEFRIEVGTPSLPFSDIGSVPADVTAATVVGLSAATTYDFRLRARNDSGNSDYSNVATATTLGGEGGGCVPSSTVLCLNDGRFRVEVGWRTAVGETGSGQTRDLTPDSALFFFFNQNNLEMLVKVLDGCAVNDHFWVFFAATTDVEFSLTVTDTETGQLRQYFNPLGQAANAITDTGAFATCP